jgi:hypothetical protein
MPIDRRHEVEAMGLDNPLQGETLRGEAAMVVRSRPSRDSILLVWER